MRIVIADDHPLEAEHVADIVRAAGHEAFVASDGIEASQLLEHGSARVLITDLELAGLSGLDLCRFVRSNDLGRYIFTVILASRSDRQSLLAGLRAGADDFLSKPVDPTELALRLVNAERVTSMETRDMMMFAMAKLAESRDQETGRHLDRVRLYCKMLAERLMLDGRSPGVDGEFVRAMFVVGPLHDIGKVGIPDAILLKSGGLTPLEYEVMKSHAAIGAATLEAALREFPGVRMLEMARDIAWCHHEHYDGTGYPRGLKGEDIPLCARIMALADVYDALRSQRVYKPAIPHDQARDQIVAAAGSHFDPGVVAAFVARDHDFAFVSSELADQASPAHRAA